MLSAQKLILVVDDTPTNIAMISGLMKEDGHRTKIATNGEKALEVASAGELPDLILLDITMPGMDGYQVCERLKSNPATSQVPVIFLTGRTDAEDEQRGFAVGAVDYIHKPFSPPLVRARVKTHLMLRSALEDAVAQRQRADSLLEVVLPKPAADEIRANGTILARRYENVAVLFCDVSNFTAFCDGHEPEEVVARLHSVFVRFEELASLHGLEKIKTIGDSFMAAAGLLQHVDDPLRAAVRCGLDMAALVDGAQLDWGVHTGVHVGPVVAGIVGEGRYQFDIWGDTVNVAARMVSKAGTGRVAVTQDVWERLAGDFVGSPLGELEVKGKGAVPVVEIQAERTASITR
jgi:adenylate cyclase